MLLIIYGAGYGGGWGGYGAGRVVWVRVGLLGSWWGC